MKFQGLMISQVNAILNVFIEEKGGYMDKNEHGAYNDNYSSKGVIVVVQMKDKSIMPCYITNNYDSGWLIWKEPNSCAGL